MFFCIVTSQVVRSRWAGFCKVWPCLPQIHFRDRNYFIWISRSSQSKS